MKTYVELQLQGKTMRGYEQVVSEDICIVMFHGFTGNKTESNGLFRKLADGLEQHGYSTLRFDWFGHGESDYTFDQITVPLLQAQAQVILDYACQKYNTVYLLGFSMGGALAMNQVDNRIEKLILLAPATQMGELKQIYFKDNDVESVDLGGFVFTRAYAKSFIGLNTVDNTKQFKGDILILQGESDQAVLLPRTIEVHKQLPHSTLKIYDQADHCFHKHSYHTQIIEDIAQFLAK